jgi:hypothetical protein
LPAQTLGDVHLRRLLAVPIGALPPLAMLMPASRDHNYWVGRLQAGTQWENVTGDLTAYAGGVDFQWRGGSVFGVTAGYQAANCEDDVIGCAPHALYGARARFNLLTGGPTFAALIGDNSATTTLGGELGLGFAPNAIAGRNACAIDLGMPVSISLFQRVRVLSFFTPGLAWDVRCPHKGSAPAGTSVILSAGVGIQQLGHRGLDVTFGAQRIIRNDSGIQLGVSITYVRLP